MNYKRILKPLLPKYIRINPLFHYWYILNIRMEKWDCERINDFQITQLNKLCNCLFDNSPFYKDKFNECGKKNFKSIDEFKQNIPVISRSEFQKNYDKIKAPLLAKYGHISSTSGTTGQALEFYHSSRDTIRELATIAYQWRRIGYNPLMQRRVIFAGLTQNLIDYHLDDNYIRCNILEFNNANIISICNEIKRLKIKYIHGYPSAIYLFTKKLIEYNLKLEIDGIMFASEQVYDFQIEFINSFFNNAKMIAHYGCAERTVLGAWCEQTQYYHILPQYSITEVDKNTGEIIGTNLYNTINGFLRYKMSDIASGYEEKCTSCGRPYPIIKNIEGREEDFIFSIEKGFIPPAIITYPFKHLKYLKEFKFIQTNEEDIQILYTTDSTDYNLISSEIATLMSNLQKVIGTKNKIEFKQVDNFRRGKTGKYKWIEKRF